MPCLDEADTIGVCVEKALRSMRENEISGEVVVADNGSVDQSREIAQSLGARVVSVDQRGYGAALMGGIESSRGEFIIMGDCDDSYDFLELPKFVQGLRNGADLVQGCRLPRGGGRVLPNAMPFLHRWFGNPFLSWLVRRMFQIPIHDVYCGMRGFSRELYNRLDLRSPGMEFATEMIIKSGLYRASMNQVPITLHPDGRTHHGPHLRTFRDGWRTLRLFLIFSPRWSFLYPGLGLISFALLGYALAIPQARPFGVALDIHTLLVCSLFAIIGWQCVLLSAFAKIFAAREKMMPQHPRLIDLSVEKIMSGGLAFVAMGLMMIVGIFIQWWTVDFGSLNYPQTMRWVIPGVTLAAIGFQTIMSALMVGLLQLHPSRRKVNGEK
ncbi:glycosyltransferase family 2 protein [bacterium]|nr:glycosyltransferase family 2 protein [Rubripirellula sp.]MDB4331731.1 glycosyltransferase family 2 protein [bacterium]MDB4339025.1 glycosyltransferase family 2 protein [Rubripirellula sp.]